MKKQIISIILITTSIGLKPNNNNNNNVWGTVTKNKVMERDDDVFIKQRNVIKYNKRTGLVESVSKHTPFNFIWFRFNIRKKVKVKHVNKQVQIVSPR